MLKLIKYELIGSYRQFFLVFLCFIIGCIVAPFLPLDFSQFTSAIVMMAGLGIFIAIFVSIILNFVKSMYKKPGYLSLTLPVSTNELVLSKIIGSVIWNILGGLVLMIGTMILVLSLSNVNINEVFDALGELFIRVDGFYSELFQSLMTLLTSLTLGVASIFLTITITQTKYVPKYKTLIGLAIYFGSSIVFNLFISWDPIVNIYSGFSTIALVITINILNILGTVIFFLATVYLIDHKIEVE